VGAFVGQQALKSGQVVMAGGSTSYDPDTKSVVGLRLGRSLLDVGPLLLQVTGGYQADATQNEKVTQNASPLPGPTPAATHSTTDYKTGHFSVGAMATLKSFVSVGAGVEYRFEKLQMDGVSTTYSRPWGRLDVGISFPTTVLKPFICLEAAVPLSSQSMTLTDSESNLKALAPKFQVGLYGGIRF
jgi:hypothetical protein